MDTANNKDLEGFDEYNDAKNRIMWEMMTKGK